MGLFRRLFGQGEKPSPRGPTRFGHSHPGDQLLNTFERHLERLSQTQPFRGSPTMMALIAPLKAAFARNLTEIAAKVARTLADGQLHSLSEISQGSGILFEVSVIPGSPQRVRAFFERHTPPGYQEGLDRLLNSPSAVQARKLGYEVLAHVIICAESTGSAIQLCLVPLDSSKTQACPRIVLPMDLLSSQDRSFFGL